MTSKATREIYTNGQRDLMHEEIMALLREKGTPATAMASVFQTRPDLYAALHNLADTTWEWRMSAGLAGCTGCGDRRPYYPLSPHMVGQHAAKWGARNPVHKDTGFPYVHLDSRFIVATDVEAAYSRPITRIAGYQVCPVANRITVPKASPAPAAVPLAGGGIMPANYAPERWLDLLPGAPTSWSDWHWLHWVPTRVREEIEAFWSPNFGRGPQDWVRDAIRQAAPRLSQFVSLPEIGTQHGMAAGFYIHCWNNIGRVVPKDAQDGEFYYVSFHATYE